MTTTPISGAAIQRYKIGYHSYEWGKRSSTPSGIPDASGSWVRYADHVTALAAGQATAAPAEPDPTPGDHPQPCDSELFESGVSVGLFDIPQWTAEALCKGIAAATGARVDWHYIGGRVHVKALPAPTLAAGQATAPQGVAYAALPDEREAFESWLRSVWTAGYGCPKCDSGKYVHGEAQRFWECWQARASHGQAPADAKALAEADRRAGEAERLLATCKEDVMRFEQVRSRMKYQWGAEQRVSFDEVWDEALALKKAAQADSVQEDAALWHWLAEYLVGTRTDLDDEIVASETVNDLRNLVEAAIKQGENHDR